MTFPVADTTCLAVSHVWVDVEWEQVEGIEERMLVSKEKAKSMYRRLHSIVGINYFSMGIRCVDQRDKADRIVVTQHIPTIFR